MRRAWLLLRLLGGFAAPLAAAVGDAVVCGVPTRLSFAELRNEYKDQDNFSVGETAKYTCRPGYGRSPGLQPSITCLENGEWSEALEFCKKKSCGHPGEPENGRVIVTDIFFGSTANFTCEEGHRLIGRPYRRCEISGMRVAWTGDVPICERIPCLPPPDIPNGRHTGLIMEEFSYGSVVTYKCDSGHPITGEASIYCTTKDGLNGEWSARPPRCGEVRCPAPQIQNGRRVSGDKHVYSYQDSVTFECNPGYIMKGHSLSQCQTDDTWDPPLPVCEPVTCVSPEVENGRTNGVQAAYRPRDTVVFECDPGYTLSGSPQTQCQDDGRWDPPVPVCERIPQCPSPPAIVNGKPSGQASAVFTTGMSVNYSCEPGYSLTGQASIYCTESGTWSPPAPQCEEVLCITPEIQNGRKVAGRGPVYRPRDKVSFECDPGYTLHGSRQIQCRDDRTWDPPVPVCRQALLCPPPPVIDKGKHNAKPLAAFPSGTHVKYSCEPGYALRGEASIYCTTSGTWSHPSPLCEEGCGVPTRLSFAELKSEYKNQSSFPVGKTINYTCRPGYSRHPQIQSTITCLQNRSWSEAFEFCKKRSCGHPGEPENGRVIVTDIFFGSTANFTCEEGHRLIGRPYRRCEISGTRVAWTGDVPICERIPCLPPPDIPNGRHTGKFRKNFFYGSAVTYKCDNGYLLTGEASIHCTTEDGRNGVWSAHPPRCGAMCISPEVENGRSNGVQAAYRPGDKVVFECDPGYTLSGSPQTQCQDDGRWDPPVPVCEKMVQCVSPPAIVNGKPSSQALAVFTTGMSVNYSCEPGYSLSGQASIYCTASGTWSPLPPRCEEVLCIAPEIQNGRKVAGRGPVYRPRDTISFECDPGYTLHGSRQIQCRDDRKWDPPVPVCRQALLCPPPPVIDKGKHNAKPLAAFPSGTHVNYSCEPGYALRGEASIYCTTSGTWSHPSPLCEEGCGVPTRLSFAELKSEYKNQSSFPVGKTINYTCRPGYSRHPQIQSTITCLQNRSWSEAFEFCKKKSCGHPGEPENGRVVVTDIFFGSTANFTCEEGHRLIGRPYRRCELSGTRVAWSGDVPVCEKIRCPAPQIQNGRRVSGDKHVYSYQDSVTFECNPGYIMKGHSLSQCQTDDTWDPPLPVCEPALLCPPPPVIDKGKHNAKPLAAFPSGTHVNYSCEPGYALRGEASIYCTTSGTWSHPSPLCEEIRCAFPEVQGGKNAVVGTTFQFGTNITVECDSGYVLEGSSLIQCQHDFTWDLPVPVCRSILGSYNFISVVLVGALLLLLLLTVIWRIKSKQNAGYYYTHENSKHQMPLVHLKEQKKFICTIAADQDI